MPVQNWAEGIWVALLGDGPDLADDLKDVAARMQVNETLVGVVLDMSTVSRLSSACLTQLLQIYRVASLRGASLRFTALPRPLRSIFGQTGLNTLFHFSPDVTTALAEMQLECGLQRL